MLSYASGLKLPAAARRDHRREPAAHRLDALAMQRRSWCRISSIRATYRQLWEQVSLAARGLLARGVSQGDRVGIWSPNRFEWVVMQFATARIGAILVNINPAYRTSELEYALRQSGVSFLLLARLSVRPTTSACSAAVKGACPDLREALVLEDGWESLLRDGDDGVGGSARRRRGSVCSSTTRSTSSTPRARPDSRRAPRCRTTTSSTTASSSAKTVRYTPARSRLHPGAVLSLLRHGARQPRVHRPTARASSSPAEAFEPAVGAADHGGGALHLALRRAHDVHRRARPSGVASVRPEPAAHRHHGRLTVPGRGDEDRCSRA